MFDGVYNYFFGGNDPAQSTANNDNATKDANEWILVDQMSGRSSPVLVADLEMQEINDDVESLASADKQNGQKMSRQRLRKIRKEIANQTKKQQVRELVQRRQEIEKKLYEDSSSTDSSSVSSSPITSMPLSSAKLEGRKPVIQRKKNAGVNIKQPKGGKGDNRQSNSK